MIIICVGCDFLFWQLLGGSFSLGCCKSVRFAGKEAVAVGTRLPTFGKGFGALNDFAGMTQHKKNRTSQTIWACLVLRACLGLFERKIRWTCFLHPFRADVSGDAYVPGRPHAGA